MNIDINDLPERYRRQALEQINNKPTAKAPNDQPGFIHEPLGAQKVKGFDRPVNITYLDRRGRLTDPDGGFTKYFTDSLVSAGLLRNDTSREVNKIDRIQTKSKEEKLTIIVEEIY